MEYKIRINTFIINCSLLTYIYHAIIKSVEDIFYYIKKSYLKKDKTNKTGINRNRKKQIKININSIFKLSTIINYLFYQILISEIQFSNGILSNITLKIKGPGAKNIFSTEFNNRYYPREVYINGAIQDPIKNSYDFN